MLLNEQVRFAEFDEKFFRLSGAWLSDPKIRFLTNTPELSEVDRADWFSQLNGRRDYLIFGATFKDVPVGVCGLKNISDRETGEYWGFIGDRSYWGKGIGGEMIRFIERIATERGLRSVFLKVIPQNTRAIKLYAKHGFQELEARSNTESIMMEKALCPDIP